MGWNTVTRSSTAYLGSYAARMEIKEFNSAVVSASMSIIFPVNQFHQSLNGYYQFFPVGNDAVLTVAASYYVDGQSTGAGSIDLETGVSSYTYFSFDPSVSGSGTPDSMWIQFTVFGNFNLSSVGSYALIDQLNLGETSDVKQINQSPSDYSLKQNFPNPFNPTTNIRFSLPEASFVTLEIFNTLGERIGMLVSEELSAGFYNYDWNAAGLTSGVYVYRIQADNLESRKAFVVTKKMILLK
ncbi:MAG: T9SS type A sorting domain-containing protein [Ignavibacteriaceae bacterium]